MANYETLKSAIQQVVKTNGNNEITGELLQQSLLAMINSLGSGYQFVDVATTATKPGTPDQKVFYIANGKGTYTNFGGISITEDEVVILYYDTAWHKLLTGIASQAKLSELEGQINGSNSDYPFEITMVKDGAGYNNIKPSALVQGLSAQHATAIDISQYVGNKIKLSFSSVSANVSRYSFITNENGDTLTYVKETSANYPLIDGRYVATLEIPQGAKYLYVTAHINANCMFFIMMSNKGLKDNIVEYVDISVGIDKDFSTLVDALNSIQDSSYNKRYRVFIHEGVYNTIEQAKLSSSYIGLLVPDYVSIIGVGNRNNIVISATCPTGYESYANNISTLNTTKHNYFENITIEATNLRYCVHDDNFALTSEAEHIYKYCKFKMNTISGVSATGSCIGIGGEYDKNIIFDTCDFINLNTSSNRACIIVHDYNKSVRGLRLKAVNCIFNGGQYSMRISTNSSVEFDNLIVINGNSFDKTNRVENNGVSANYFSIRGYGNKDFSYVLGGTLTDISDKVNVW